MDEVNTSNFGECLFVLKDTMFQMQKQNPGHYNPNQYHGSKWQVTQAFQENRDEK
jgi:hypothetical protein